MNRVRIIPVLTIDEQKLVKTVRFRKPNYLGDPINAIKIFNDKEVDEIAVLDITASRQGREPNFKLIQEMASECFMPMAYGGGITNLEQVKQLFSLGIEKVILNSVLMQDTQLISQAANLYGSQSILASLDIKKNLFGKPRAAFYSGEKTSDIAPLDLARHYEQSGAGEILLHNVDRDGTFSGLDTDLISLIANGLGIPVIACGGTRSLEDMLAGVKAGASAIAAGSFFAYRNNDTHSILISYPSQQALAEKIYKYI